MEHGKIAAIMRKNRHVRRVVLKADWLILQAMKEWAMRKVQEGWC